MFTIYPLLYDTIASYTGLFPLPWEKLKYIAVLCLFNLFCRFGSTTRQIWLDNVNCIGTESRLTSCSRNSYGSHNCSHSEDVAIYCGTPSSGSGGSGIWFHYQRVFLFAENGWSNQIQNSWTIHPPHVHLTLFMWWQVFSGLSQFLLLFYYYTEHWPKKKKKK